jgi:hypothetical protein
MPLAVPQSLRHTGSRVLDALHRHPLRWALVLAATSTALLLVTLTPRYEANDDIGMQAVVDGTLIGEPQPDLIVSNVVLGLALEGLYRAAGGFPWYGAYLYALQFAALAALTYVVLAGRREDLAGRLLLLGAVVAVFHVPLWLDLQFTSTALLLGATGVVVFRSAVDRARFPWTATVAAAAMVGISWWVRWRSGAAVVLLAAVFLAPALRRANWRRFAAFAGITFTVLAAGWVAQAIHYGGQPEWQEYFAFNELRGQLHQARHLGEVDPAVLTGAGWTENDLRMFDNWFFSDPGVYQLEDLEAIAAAVPQPFEADEGLGLLRDQGTGWAGGCRVALAAALGGLAWVQGDRRRRWTVALGALASVGAGFFLAATAKLPTRVALPLLASLAVLFLSSLGDPDRRPTGARTRAGTAWLAVAAVLAAGALVIGSLAAVESSRGSDAQAAARRKLLTGLEAVDPTGVFVAWGAEVPRWAAPLSPGTGGPHLVVLGWMQQSPTAAAVLDRYGIDDLYATIARGDAYLPLHRVELGALYLTYLSEHYGFSGLLVPVAEVSRLTVFRGVSAYALDAAAGFLVETRFDGSTAAYPLVSGVSEGSAAAALDEAGQLVVAGRTDADLIVILDGDEAIALALPIASEDRRPRFEATLAYLPRDLRLLALSGGLAREITVTFEEP